MGELLEKLNGGEIIGFASVAGFWLCGIIGLVAYQWRRVRIAEIEGALKQQMLERGMSAAEIEAVMKASQTPACAETVTSTGNEAADRAALVQRMVDNGYEGEDIERVLKAYQVSPKSPEVKAMQNAM